MRRLSNECYAFLRRMIAPDLKYSQLLFEEVLERSVSETTVWLDVGCGHQLLPSWRIEYERALVERTRCIVGIDPYHPSIVRHSSITKRVAGSASALPFENATFDLVTANMVVEHLDDPQRQFSEIVRVLKPGGRFVFHTVNRAGYFARMRAIVPDRLAKPLAGILDGRSSADVFGVHYLANRESEIYELSERAGARIESIRFISSDAVFAVVPPLAAVELAWIRLLMRPSFKRLRTNIIVALRKNDVDR
ncbi:MAG TPA: methyltransferase domain-containing protein [Pyrinomonadaceae bacterium]|nr:methyltransferase domain-containing protein [Pyrinomonadaceae bacterium]